MHATTVYPVILFSPQEVAVRSGNRSPLPCTFPPLVIRLGSCSDITFSSLFEVTKEKYYHKPTYNSLQSSLTAMRDHCVSHGVTSISMPRIGCGLDGLQWPKVKNIIIQVFQDTDVKLTVYKL